MRPKYAEAIRDLESLLVILRAKQAGVFSDLGPEGIRETQQLSEITHGLAARTRSLRKMMDQGAEPVFRRLLKQSGYLEAARKALKAGLAASNTMSDLWKAYSTAEDEFIRQLSQQAPDQYQAYKQIQRSEGA